VTLGEASTPGAAAASRLPHPQLASTPPTVVLKALRPAGPASRPDGPLHGFHRLSASHPTRSVGGGQRALPPAPRAKAATPGPPCDRRRLGKLIVQPEKVVLATRDDRVLRLKPQGEEPNPILERADVAKIPPKLRAGQVRAVAAKGAASHSPRRSDRGDDEDPALAQRLLLGPTHAAVVNPVRPSSRQLFEPALWPPERPPTAPPLLSGGDTGHKSLAAERPVARHAATLHRQRLQELSRSVRPLSVASANLHSLDIPLGPDSYLVSGAFS